MIGVWVVAGLIGAVAIYMTGWVKGRAHGIAEGHAEAGHRWDALAKRLAGDCRRWQAQLDEVEAEVRQADDAIDRLIAERKANYDAGFLAALNAKEPTP
jgi:hypothetical protein